MTGLFSAEKMPLLAIGKSNHNFRIPIKVAKATSAGKVIPILFNIATAEVNGIRRQAFIKML